MKVDYIHLRAPEGRLIKSQPEKHHGAGYTTPGPICTSDKTREIGTETEQQNNRTSEQQNARGPEWQHGIL